MDETYICDIILLVPLSFTSSSVGLSTISVIGRGGSSIVLQISCPQFTARSDKILALKLFNDEHYQNKGYEVGIYQKVLKEINHEFIMKAYGYGEGFICLEYISNVCLDDYLKKYPELSPTIYVLVFTLAEVSEAISMLHAIGIVHQDIKGSNILIRENGHLTICDFGSSSINNTPMKPFKRNMQGTSIHVAPELGKPWILYLDHSVDYYSLGSLICTMISFGKTPNSFDPSYDYNSPATFAFIPHTIRKTIASLMNPNKHARMCNGRNGNVSLLLEPGIKSILWSKLGEYLSVFEIKERIQNMCLETPFI